MNKLKRIYLCLAAGLILLAIASCNLPFSSPATPTAAPITSDPAPDPLAPANTDGAETLRIRGGTFAMGSAESDTLAATDERPVHQVSVGTFFLYTHEVTNEMYLACADSGACLPINVMDSGPTTHSADPAFARHPVVGVDWNMAHAYCTWAGGRLPTEAEWEYAARGEESLLYPWGATEPSCDQVNMLGCAVPPDTLPVGSFLLGNSPFEVWDLSGNVWEWVYDWYAESYYALSPSIDPLGPYASLDPSHPLKVVRGGGLFSAPEQMRSADRAATNPYRAYDDVGFRCVAEGEALPTAYTTPRERHEMVTPDPLDGGGDHLDDPEDETDRYTMGASLATCPADDGTITIYIEAETNVPGEYSATVEGVPFACTYNESDGLLTCTGPAPAVTEFPGEYHVRVTFPGGGVIGHAYPEIPTDCDGGPDRTMSMDVTVDCPEDGWVTFSLVTNPPMYLDYIFVFDGGIVEIPCWQVSDTGTICITPEASFDPSLQIHYHGHGLDDVTNYVWIGDISIPAACPATPHTLTLEPFCYEDHPLVQINFIPAFLPPSSVSSFGVPLGCIGMTANLEYCGPLVGTAGSATSVTTCFPDQPCLDWPITIPDCSSPARAIVVDITSTCYETLGPVAVIHYAPSESPLVSADADGVPLTCYDTAEPGWYMCSGLPDAPGSTSTINFCLEDGTCLNQTITVSDCGLATFTPDFSLAALGCANATDIYFIVDTGLEWLVPGASYTYSAYDEATGYSCTVHPTLPGRIYCAAPRPETPGILQVCVQNDADPPPPICQSFTDYPAWVGDLPPCSEAPEPVEPDPVDPCSVYTTRGVCEAHKDSCRWLTDHCESNP